MPARNPRVNVVLEKPLFEALRQVAEQENVSMSMKARDLLRQSLELYEDLALAGLAEEREATFDRQTALTHEQAWDLETG